MAMRYYAPFPGDGSFPGDYGGPPRPGGGPHALRIGDAERDAAAADLGEHYAAGRLTLDELHERLDAAFAAKTFGHLSRVMADLPGPGRLPWHAGPGWVAVPGRPGLMLPDMWGPAGFRYHGHLASPDDPWHPWHRGHPWQREHPVAAGNQSRKPQGTPTPADRAGRFAALSLLMLAMLIWLFTALLFARHGISHQFGPVVPSGPSYQQWQPGSP